MITRALFGVASMMETTKMPPYPRKRTRPLGLFVLVIGAGILAFSPRSRASRALWVPRVNQRAVVNLKKCPPCDLLFSKLEPTPNEKRFQIVQIQERGEPKSGTGFMLEWAGGTLMHACAYLKKWFGDATCNVVWSLSGDRLHDLKHMNMTFVPRLAGDMKHCPCPAVDRVTVTLRGANKHRLPMSQQNCSVVHGAGIPSQGVCTFSDGRTPSNYHELSHCVREAACPIIDQQHQMVVFRDPRPLVVSAYFYLATLKRAHGTVDDYVVKMLPTYTQWVAVRYDLFAGSMTKQSTFFWYDDAMEDPLAWHHQWLAAAGLQLPHNVVEATVQAALRHEFGFPTKGVDPHPGGHNTTSVRRPYRDEVTPQTLEFMDSVLRQWLPPALLAKFNVPLVVEQSVVTVSVGHAMVKSVESQEVVILLVIFVGAALMLVTCVCRRRNKRKRMYSSRRRSSIATGN